SIVYGDRFILKMFRRLEEGTSPDLEVGRFLGEKGFTHAPPLAGAIEYQRSGGEPITLAILQGFVQNRGDAWRYTLESLSAYFERVIGQPEQAQPELHGGHLLDMAAEDTAQGYQEAFGGYLESARLLGRRTAELHLTLASDASDPAFAPEPF